MGRNIEKFKLLERVKISLLKNLGNVVAVSEELNLDLDYVRKLVAKIKKQEEKDVKVLISNTLMQYIFSGHKSRVTHYAEMLKQLEGRSQILVSICCRKPVREESEGFVCLKCQRVCEVDTVDRENVYRIKMDILKELREESRVLVEFAEKMGYTNKEPEEPPTIVRNQQNVLVLGKDLTDKEKSVLRDIASMSPVDRERIRKELKKELEKEVIDVEDEES